jgi:hypothetical protein
MIRQTVRQVRQGTVLCLRSQGLRYRTVPCFILKSAKLKNYRKINHKLFCDSKYFILVWYGHYVSTRIIIILTK